MNLTQKDYRVLWMMEEHKLTTPLRAIPINEVSKRAGVSLSKARDTVRKFKKLGYIKEGAYIVKAKTYYITEKGLVTIIKLRGFSLHDD